MLAKSYNTVSIGSCSLLVLALVILGVFMPRTTAVTAVTASTASTASTTSQLGQQDQPKKLQQNKQAQHWLDITSARTPGAAVLMFTKLTLGIAFHMYSTISIYSMRSRFQITRQQHAYMLAMIGLSFSLGQGLIAKPVLQRFGKRTTLLMVVLNLGLMSGRVFAMQATQLWHVYPAQALIGLSWAIVNTEISTATSRLAANDEVGGLFGLLEGASKCAGLVGPVLAGILSEANNQGAAAAAAVSTNDTALGGGGDSTSSTPGKQTLYVLLFICLVHVLNIVVAALFYETAVTQGTANEKDKHTKSS